MEWIWIVLLIGISVVNGIRKNKKKQEAEKNAPQHITRPESGSMQPSATGHPSTSRAELSKEGGVSAPPKARTRAAMVEEQRRRAQAYQRQAGYPVNTPPTQQDLPPWKRTVVSPANPDVAPIAQRLADPPVNPPAKVEAGPAPVQRQSTPYPRPSRIRETVAVPSAPPSVAGMAAEPYQLPQSGAAWRQALLLGEILAPPKAKRPLARNRRIL